MTVEQRLERVEERLGSILERLATLEESQRYVGKSINNFCHNCEEQMSQHNRRLNNQAEAITEIRLTLAGWRGLAVALGVIAATIGAISQGAVQLVLRLL